MEKKFSSRKLATSLLLLFAWLLVGCSAVPEKSRKPSDDWSRGIPLGTDVLGTVAMAVDQDSEDVYAVFPFWSFKKDYDSQLIKEDSSGGVKTASVPNIYAVWPSFSETGGFGLRYVQIGQDAEILFDREVAKLPGQVS